MFNEGHDKVKKAAEKLKELTFDAVIIAAPQTKDKKPLEFVNLKQKEFPGHVNVDPELSQTQQQQIREVLRHYPETLSDLPGKTHVVEHKIRLTSDTPFRIKQYPIPVHAIDAVNQEIDNMLKAGIIRPSTSPYASPITVVMKRDKTIRLCIDFRKLNSITIFDAHAPTEMKRRPIRE